MTIVRFIGYIIGPWLAPLLLIPLAVAWIILTLVVATGNMWLRAKRDPRYDPYL